MTVWFRLDSERYIKINELAIAVFLGKVFGMLGLPWLRGIQKQVIDNLIHRNRGYHEVDTNA